MIAVFLVNAFAQLDLSHARQSLTRPVRLLSATAWAMLVIPALFWAFLNIIGRDRFDPGFVLALSLQAGAAPIMATPAVALVLGMEVTFAVLLLLTTMSIQPFTAPVLVSWVAGTAIPIDSFVLGRNLFIMVGGSALVAAGLRLWLGHARLDAYRHELAGIKLLVFTLFGLAMFDGVVLRFFAEPFLLLGLSAVAFIVALGSIGIAMIVRAMGADEAFITGFATGHRNVGLMAAAPAVRQMRARPSLLEASLISALTSSTRWTRVSRFRSSVRRFLTGTARTPSVRLVSGAMSCTSQTRTRRAVEWRRPSSSAQGKSPNSLYGCLCPRSIS
jgi:BASS family bile acid:Na+ symporter